MAQNQNGQYVKPSADDKQYAASHILAAAAENVKAELRSTQYIRRSLFINDNRMGEYKDEERYLNEVVENTIDNERKGNLDNIDLSYAQIFAGAVANSLVVTDMFHQQIDALAADENYREYFAKFSPDDKLAFCSELKDSVTEKLAVKPGSAYGKQLAGNLSAIFRETIAGAQNGRKDRFTLRAEFMRDVMLPVEIITDSQRANRRVSTEVIADTFHNAQPATSIVSDALRDHAVELASERRYLEPIVSKVFVDGDMEIDPTKFAKNYKNFDLSNDEETWARCVFDNAMEKISKDIDRDNAIVPDFANFKLNGKMMFDSQDLLRCHPDKLKLDVISHMIDGNQVTYTDPETETETLLSPDFKYEKELSYFQRIINFIKELLGISTENELDIMKREANERAEEFKDLGVARRENVTFNELAGIDNANKVGSIRLNAKETEKQLEHNTPQKTL